MLNHHRVQMMYKNEYVLKILGLIFHHCFFQILILYFFENNLFRHINIFKIKIVFNNISNSFFYLQTLENLDELIVQHDYHEQLILVVIVLNHQHIYYLEINI